MTPEQGGEGQHSPEDSSPNVTPQRQLILDLNRVISGVAQPEDVVSDITWGPDGMVVLHLGRTATDL